MTTAANAPDLAQCITCAGVLVPSGDDWTHLDNTGCTLYGTPVLCNRSDCGMPAAIGAPACGDHAGFLVPTNYTAASSDRDRLEMEGDSTDGFVHSRHP